MTLLPNDDADNCPVNELVRYDNEKPNVIMANYKFDATEIGPRSSIFTITEQVKYKYNVRTSGEKSFRQSNQVEATVTVCGME